MQRKHVYVYILTNRYRTVLYTGITNDLERRVAQHREGPGKSFTARYRVRDVVYYETFGEPLMAIAREKEIKGWRRARKLALIRSTNPDLRTLTPWEDTGDTA